MCKNHSIVMTLYRSALITEKNVSKIYPWNSKSISIGQIHLVPENIEANIAETFVILRIWKHLNFSNVWSATWDNWNHSQPFSFFLSFNFFKYGQTPLNNQSFFVYVGPHFCSSCIELLFLIRGNRWLSKTCIVLKLMQSQLMSSRLVCSLLMFCK